MVILSSDDEMAQYYDLDHRACTLCGEPHALKAYPVLVWTGLGAMGSDLFICRGCCRHLVPGFTADLIQVDAINRLRAAGYPGETLQRTGLDSLPVNKPNLSQSYAEGYNALLLKNRHLIEELELLRRDIHAANAEVTRLVKELERAHTCPSS